MARTSTSTRTKPAGKTTRLASPLQMGHASGSRKTLAADAPLPGENPLPKMAKPTELQLVNSLTNAEGFHRDALMIELSVGLAFYASQSESNKVDLAAKKGLRAIYGKAGYDCLTPQGADYQTVARRTSVTALLFTHIGGHETIRDWVMDASPSKMVVKIQESLGARKFDSINDVLAYVGKPVVAPAKKTPKATAAPAPTTQVVTPPPAPQLTEAEQLMAAQLDAQMLERKLAEKSGLPPGRVFTSGPLQLAIPFNAKYDDVMKIALELMAFAKTQMELPVDKGAPSVAAAPAPVATA